MATACDNNNNVNKKYFSDFPTTFPNNYEEKQIIENSKDMERGIQEIAEAVTQLYVTALKSPVEEEMPRSATDGKLKGFSNQQIETFQSQLKKYIIERLSDDKMVRLTTDKNPEKELDKIFKRCGMDLEDKATRGIYFLPYKSLVDISPHIQHDVGDDFINIPGINVFIQRL